MVWQRIRRLLAASLAAALLFVPVAPASAQDGFGPVTNLPMPRFVSLKSDQVNVRVGPGPEYPISWTYVRFGLPVEIIAEYDNWRRVRDANGNEGWVLSTLLSGDRWIIVLITNDGTNLTVRSEPAEAAQIVAYLEPGVLVAVERCQNGWCRLVDNRFSGWVAQNRLWGVYPGEEF
jgi:SH3-like domain-containing protein